MEIKAAKKSMFFKTFIVHSVSEKTTKLELELKLTDGKEKS